MNLASYGVSGASVMLIANKQEKEPNTNQKSAIAKAFASKKFPIISMRL